MIVETERLILAGEYPANYREAMKLRDTVISLVTCEEQRDNMFLILSELLTNAVKHACQELGSFAFALYQTADGYQVRVISPRAPGDDRFWERETEAKRNFDMTHGRGLWIVMTIARKVDFVQTYQTTTVTAWI